MTSEWKEVKLGDVLTFYNGKKRPTDQGIIPVYGGNGILDYCNSYNTEGEGIIIGRVGAYCGNVNYVNEKCWISDNAILTKVKETYCGRFIYYLLIKLNLNSHHIGSSQPLLTQNILKSLRVMIPPLNEQNAIAHILSTIDEKIETNNQINKKLEEIAQNIFKHWFIDFEFPNKNGDPYKSSGGEMVESELGMIPKGWEVSTVGSLTKVVSKGTTPRKIDINNATDDNNIRFLKVKDINNDGIIDLTGLELIPSSIHLNQLKRSALKYKDVLISIAGTIGRVSYASDELIDANINQAIAFVRLKSIDKYFLLVFYKFKSDEFQSSIRSKIVQGVQANISLSVLKNEKIILPDDGVLQLYNNILSRLFEKNSILYKEINNLGTLQDTLLPKLMSGQIRVPLEDKKESYS